MPNRPSPPTPGELDRDRLAQSVDRIVGTIEGDSRTRRITNAWLPDSSEVDELLERLRAIVFPGFFGPRDLSREHLREHVREAVDELVGPLLKQVSAALRYEIHGGEGERANPEAFARRCAECDERAARIVDEFCARLPAVRELVSLDVQAAYDGDPAAMHTDEAIFCYPGVHALLVHRCAHELYRLDVPLLPRMMAEISHGRTGIDIHPGARIGRSFFIDHGTGVVIGETTVIGDHCTVYQGVTLGAKSFPRTPDGRFDRTIKRHPTLEDHVTVYAAATILGGDTVIGAGSVVNGGVFLTRSIPPGHVVRGPKIDVSLRSNPDLPPAAYSI